jgi:NAD(P)-dependent dehydrogenase (short-subunit alcohol dehydrogenase family)
MTRPAAASLAGQAAVVTGAGRGLGRAIALALAGAGCRVVVTARSEPELQETAELIRASGGQAWAVPADVTVPADVARLRDFAAEHAGPVDIVVNNAGNLVVQPFVALPTEPGRVPDGMDTGLTYEQWRSTHAVHLDGAFHVLQAFAPDMLARRYGRVINIVSSAINRAVPFTSAYDAAKGALAQLTRSLAYEWARHGVTVNAIAVGQIRTQMTAAVHDDPASAEWLIRRIPMRRVGEPGEVGRLVVVLAGAESAFLTGQVIGLDGGESL